MFDVDTKQYLFCFVLKKDQRHKILPTLKKSEAVSNIDGLISFSKQ